MLNDLQVRTSDLGTSTPWLYNNNVNNILLSRELFENLQNPTYT